MKRSAILVSIVALAFVFCASPSFACTQPPIQPSGVLGLETWPTNELVGIAVNTVPVGPVTTASNNWNYALGNPVILCAPLFVLGAQYPGTITMSFNALPPPPNCPPTYICFTRGITDFVGWTSGRLSSATMQINNTITSIAAMTEVVAHEIGHTMGLADCNYPRCSPGSSVMETGAQKDVNGNPVTGVNSVVGQPGPTTCDIAAVLLAAPNYICPPPPPPPPPRCCKCPGPNPAKGEQTYNGFALRKVQSGGCQTGWSTDCCGSTPIIIDTSGNGFVLTSAANGVKFDISGNGYPVQLGWTAPGVGNAFLCLPDTNGACDDGTDLFGNNTPQPPSQTPNGFAALAVYDQPANGGNGDGIIDSRDAIFASLRLWIDANHDGISQPNEIYTLPALGVYSISLNYQLSERTDQYGNLFRYKAVVNPNDLDASHVGRIAYDVFFVTQSGGSTVTAQSCPAVPRLLPEGKDGRLH